MRGWIFGLVAVVVLVFVVGVGVIVVLTTDSRTSIVDLAAGDCFDLPDAAGDQVDEVEVVDCAEPHLAEVVAVGSLNDSGDVPYPDDDEVLFALVDAECRTISPVGSDAFGLLPIAPTRQLWDAFEGRFLCVAIPFGGEPVTGSIVAG